MRKSNEYQRAISEYSLVWLDPRRDRVDGEPLLGMLLPLRAEDDELLGVFGVDMPLDYIRERLLGLGRLTGATGAYLLDGSGMILLDTDTEFTTPPSKGGVDLSLDFGRYPVEEVVEVFGKGVPAFTEQPLGRL